MNSVTEPVKEARHGGNSRGAKEWLDALSSGACDHAQFLQGVGELLGRAPDAGWELLALLDQYFRRGKISAQVFGAIKTHLQALLVGKGDSDEVSNPIPRMQDEPPPGEAAPPAVAVTLARRAAAAAAAVAVPAAAPLAPTLPGPTGKASAAEHLLAPGDLLRGRYRLLGLLGRGGMGVVYAAIDQFRLDRASEDQKVALKVLHTEVIKRPQLFAELRREFQYLQSLSHPNIVRVHEFDRDGDLAFFTMEYLSGALLSRALAVQESKALYRPYALAIIRDLGSAVAHAHSRGVVHGDLNPGNVFITDGGDLRVLDFGASHQLHRGPWISEFDGHAQVAVATPGFASCQVLEGETAEARDDVYALACIAYLLLTGQRPFKDQTPLHARTTGATPQRPRNLTAQQWKALRAGLEFDRERRPSDVGAWVRQLNPGGAAPHLPPLVSLWTSQPHRNYGRIWAHAVAAAVCVGCGWVAAVNADWLSSSGAAVGGRLKALYAQLFDDARETADTPAPSGQNLPLQTVPLATRPTPVPAAPAARPAPAPTARLAPAPAARLAAAPTARLAPAPAASLPPSAAPATEGGSAGAYPRARIELTADNIEVGAAESIARVVVHRSRSLRGDVGFTWWTESGTAKPIRDFVPVKVQAAHLENGQSTVSLVIPVVVDPARRESRNFYVVIDDPSDNAALGSRTLTMITLPGAEPEPAAESGR